MNLFRSEEDARIWQKLHGVQGVTISVEQTLAWVTFIGKDRPKLDYTHPRATGTLGPFLRSIGLTGDFWNPR